MKRIFLIITFLLPFFFFGQNLYGKFLINVLPDNGWILYLYKNNTFKYSHFSGWSKGEEFRDAGVYTLTNNEINLISNKPESSSLITEHYFLKIFKVKKNQDIDIHIGKYRDKGLFKDTIYLLTIEKDIEFEIISK